LEATETHAASPAHSGRGEIVNLYVYRWSIKPEVGLTLDLRMTAPSVLIAQREVHRFLEDHDGESWGIEYVTREHSTAPRPSMPVSQSSAARS
jgi:hypothetical protein